MDLDMLPGFAELNVRDSALGNAEIPSDVELSVALRYPLSNGDNIPLCERGVVVMFAPWHALRMRARAVSISPSYTFRMCSRGMSFALGWVVASFGEAVSVVIKEGPEPKVSGIAARGIVAGVQHKHRVRDFPGMGHPRQHYSMVELIRHAVSLVDFSVPRDDAISLPISQANPGPTLLRAARLYFGPEAFWRVSNLPSARHA